ncbi:DNA polymerase IV [Eupransor demetentiae]|uniref:DNA polymerase IV n=1 Tax=Eupransor demetentiae TaxID=3109584 RepID=A0ABM9N537_9LACO|nr:Nucleotidyltransferase/DNA polymerase DinP involved in DNA repair (DinP) [Lactobacillaceae bacterium LMG 33000]
MAEFLKAVDDRKILHVDLDAFYAQIEMRDNPNLKGKAVVIARDPLESHGHGVVATANYQARQFGIHSAMSAMEAKRLAPDAVFVRPDFDKYRRISNQIHTIFHEFTPKIEPVALDEAYLDITDNPHSGAAVAAEIRHRILKETKLTSSVGVSYNKLLAKLGSGYNKPNGVTVIDPQQAQAFMDALPIASFRGVGRRGQEKFAKLGVETGRQLRALTLDELRALFGKLGDVLYWQARGVHFGQVAWQRQRQSVGKEATFDQPLHDMTAVNTHFRRLAEQVSAKMQSKNFAARTLNVKIRLDNYQTITRSITQSAVWPLEVGAMVQAAENIFEENVDEPFSIRLLGISFSNIESKSFDPVSLFDLPN